MDVIKIQSSVFYLLGCPVSVYGPPLYIWSSGFGLIIFFSVLSFLFIRSNSFGLITLCHNILTIVFLKLKSLQIGD